MVHHREVSADCRATFRSFTAARRGSAASSTPFKVKLCSRCGHISIVLVWTKPDHGGRHVMISCPGTFQNALGTYVNAITYVTLRRAPRGRPDLAGCLSRCVRTDGRVEVCAKSFPTLIEPCTFVQWMLKEQHSHQTFGQWRRHQSDGQAGLPSTVLDHVSATERSPRSPPRPQVSVGTIHGQSTSGWRSATSGVERAIRQLVIGISDRTGASWPSEPTRDA